MSRLKGYLQLMRPVNCFMMGFAVIVGATLASPATLGNSLLSLVFGFITGFCLTAASMVINDYYDREIDAINEPNRPIPSGMVKPREALILAAVLSVFGFVAAFFTNLFCFAVSVIAWLIVVTYTTVGKRSGLPGNFLVSVCVTIPFLYGSIAVVNRVELNVSLFAAMAFLSNTGREITKGIVDVKGDRSQNVKTLAVRYGEKKAAVAAALFYLSAVSLSPVPWFLGLVSVLFIPFVTVTDLGLIASSIMLLKDSSRDKARKIKKIVLLWFMFGLLAFVLGTINIS